MKTERGLLPWVLGGLSAATIAVAFAAVSSHRAEATLPPPPTATPTPLIAAQAPALPAAVPVSATTQATSPVTPATEPESQVPSSPAPPQSAVAQEATGGQIWACTTRGVKTFSNNPCGENSTLLDIGPINTMRATPAIHYVRPYGSAAGAAPAYASGYPDQGVADDSEDSADQYPAEAGANSYTIVQGVRFVRRKRPDHFHLPHPHHNPAQNPGHHSMAARRN